MQSRIKEVFVSILQSQQMTDLFVIKPGQFSPSYLNVHMENIIIDDQKTQPDYAQFDEGKSSISRLQIEIKKHNFDFQPLSSQFFLLVFKASLVGKSLNEYGLLMITNYRIIFFKGAARRVDLPFGLISSCKFNDKLSEVTFQLKYPHSWTFIMLSNLSKFQLLKNFLSIYFKPNEIRNNFSFEFKLKSPVHTNQQQYHINTEYLRLKMRDPLFCSNYKLLKNSHFCISSSYTESLYVPSQGVNFQAAARHRKLNRLPILAYLHQGCNHNSSLPIWISSSYQDIKSITKNLQTVYLKALSKERPVEVYICQGKSSKNVEQSSFSVFFSANYLGFQSNEELSKSENALIGVFLHKKVPIITQILNSKWYHYIARCLDSCLQLCNSILAQRAVLVRCEQGRDKSLLLASLAQIVLDPYYRQIAGFQALVMKMFVHFGHPFASRLGERHQCREKSPIFLQFLDCVNQLINQNSTSFEYNAKYLSSLANLMQINIYGTFIADSPKEFIQNKVEQETFSIWTGLKTALTSNSSYVKNSGVLNFNSSLSSLVLWRQYFGSLISKKKDSYRLSEQAEENEDYIKVRSKAIKSQNQYLLKKLKECKLALQQLQQQQKT